MNAAQSAKAGAGNAAPKATDDDGKKARIVRDLQRQIDDGTIPVGQRLPGKRAVGEQFGVAEATGMAILRELAATGYAIVKGTNGYFARKPDPAADDPAPPSLREAVAALNNSLAGALDRLKAQEEEQAVTRRVVDELGQQVRELGQQLAAYRDSRRPSA